MATRASPAAGWSTSSSSVLSDWTINGPSLTAHSSTRDRVPHQNLGRNATRGGRQFVGERQAAPRGRGPPTSAAGTAGSPGYSVPATTESAREPPRSYRVL